MLPSIALQLFREQYGYIACRQLAETLTRNDRRRVYRHPDVERVNSRILRHLAVPSSLCGQLIAPVLDAGPGTVLWGSSASLLFGFGRDRDPLVHVARLLHSAPNPLGRVHRLVTLEPVDVTDHLGVPVARAERVILALAEAATRDWKPTRFKHTELTDVQVLAPVIAHMAKVLDHAWSMGLIDGERIHDLCERMRGHGQAGIVVLRELLRTRPPDYIPPESGLEIRFEEIIGFLVSELDRQVEVFDAEGLIGRVDYHAKELPLVFEINGERFHTSLTDRAEDEARYRRILVTGRSVVVLWEYDVWQRSKQVRQVVTDRLRLRDPVPTLHRPTMAPWQLLPESASQRDLCA